MTMTNEKMTNDQLGIGIWSLRNWIGIWSSGLDDQGQALWNREGYSAGQATAGGVVFIMIIILTAAVLVDVFHLMQVRNFAYGLAADAALVGASLGRDFTGYYEQPHRGELWLDEHEARIAAENHVAEEMAAHGITDYYVQVEVITSPHGGTIPHFPPVPRASLAGITHWTTDEPAVGVYLAIPVDTNLLGLVNGGGPVTVHAFHASKVTRRIP